MKERMKYSKVCAAITNSLDNYIPKRFVDVMYDEDECVYHVKVRNAFGKAEYAFSWMQVITFGTNSVVERIKRDFIYPKECEE